MAALGAPVGKDAFFEALSNRERAAPAGPGDATADFQDVGGSAGQAEEGEDEEEDEGEARAEEEAETDPEADQTFQQFLEGTDSEEEGGASPEDPPPIPEQWPEDGEDVDDLASDIRNVSVKESLKQPRGAISSYRSTKEMQRSLENQRIGKGMEFLRHDATVKAAGAEDARVALDDEERKLRALKRQAADGTLTDPALLSFQEQEVAHAWARLTETEKDRDDAHLLLSRCQDAVGEPATQAMQGEAGEAHAVAQQRHKSEIRRAKQVLKQERELVEAAREREQMYEEMAMHREMAATEGQAKGQARLRESQKVHRARRAEAEKVREAQFQKDASRVLELKASTDEIRKHIQSQNERRSKKEALRRYEQEQRKIDLLNSGLNPYEVWRREDMDEVKRKQMEKLQKARALRNEKLVEQMLEEDKRDKRNKKEAHRKRVEAEEFAKEVGTYNKEKRIAAYIRKMTIGNVEVLDPTGKAVRIDASKVTIQKTGAFGTGRAKPEEIDLVDKTIRKQKALNASRRPPRPDSLDFDAMEGGDDLAAVTGEQFGAGQESGKLWVPKLTKLEEQYLAAARERQKQNITSVQRCWGKEFKGDGFLASPGIIEFKDFEAGKQYRQIIQVTNVSLTFNQFKLLPLEDSIKDFFEIQFVPPGRMSAGVTRYITLWFVPKFNKDIDTTFPILAKTGRIDFPLRCVTKKTKLAITPQDEDANGYIDFGKVLAGESSTQKLRVRNFGALAPTFEITNLDPGNKFFERLSWTPSKGEFPSDATTNISFTFSPPEDFIGDYSASLHLSMQNGADGDAAFSEEMEILIEGSCVDVPIYFPQEEWDFKICIFGHIYRENVVVKNRRRDTMRVEVVKPKEIPGELQIVPITSFVQGNSDQILAVKFCPKDDFLSRHKEYRDPKRAGQPGAFRIPIKVVGVDQVLPACTDLVGTLTQNTVVFEPSKLQFDKCFVGSAVSSRLTLVNECLLPQQFAFPRLPGFLSVDEVPEDVREEESGRMVGQNTAVLENGPAAWNGRLLPGERRQLVVTYAPEAAVEMAHKMICKVISGGQCVRDFSVMCKGQGLTPMLSLSHTQVDMASVPCDMMAQESITVTNVSKYPCVISVQMPPEELSAIHGSPVCYMLEQNESRRLLLRFSPNQGYVDLLKLREEEPEKKEEPEAAEEPAEVAPPPPADGKKGRKSPAPAKGRKTPATPEPPDEPPPPESEEPKLTPEELRDLKVQEIRESGGRRWDVPERGTVHSSWRVPIYIKSLRPKAGEEEGSEGPASPTSPGGTRSKAKNRGPVVFFGVSTCVKPCALKAQPAVLDFGEVTAQQRVVLPVDLENQFPDVPQELQFDTLPDNQCFTVLNAPRTIDSRFSMMVAFEPAMVQDYETVLSLRTQNTRVQVPLKGRGVRPVLKIEPEDGLLHLGAVIYSRECKDYTTATLTVRNESAFELRFSLESIVQADPNHAGPPPFTLSPSVGVVEANGAKAVTVTFRPHRPLGIFREKVLVNVPSQEEPTYVYLFGHCFKYQAYAIHDVPLAPFGRPEARKAEGAFTDALAVGLGSGVGEAGHFEYPRAMPKDFVVRFEGEERVKCLVMGGCAPPGTPAAPQTTSAMSFEFKIEDSEFSKLFTVEAMEEKGGKPDKTAKGVIVAGKAGPKVAFRFNPPADSPLAVGNMTLDVLAGIGQWVSCVVKGTLNGGFAPAGAPNALQEITVELKGYLQQI